MKSNIQQLKSRGYIEEADLIEYKSFSKDDLLNMLGSSVAAERTAAAMLLANYIEDNVVDKLVQQLKIEKKLYSKIAITNTLASYGLLSCNILIENLGRIGNNQHKTLPNKPFKKRSYPLPRDIAARTLCEIGEPAIKPLLKCIANDNEIQISEALDAIGFISYYNHNNTALETIIKMIEIYKENDLIVWKLLRALQAFDGEEVISILDKYAESDILQHRLEAERSIAQIRAR